MRPVTAVLVGLMAPLSMWAAGCCSVDDLREVSGPRDDVAGIVSHAADERREVLACVAEVGSEGDPTARAEAIAAARRWLDPDVEPDAALRATCVRVLEALMVRPALPEVAARLAPQPDPSIHVRIAAVCALGAFRGPAAEEALRSTLTRDAAREVRAAAARELGEMSSVDPAVSGALIAALRDEALEVRLLAARSLRTRHAIDLGFDAETWRGWLSRQPAPDVAPPPEEAPWVEDELPYEEDMTAPEPEGPAPDAPMPDAPGDQPPPTPPEPHDPTDEPGDEPTGPPFIPPAGGGGR